MKPCFVKLQRAHLPEIVLITSYGMPFESTNGFLRKIIVESTTPLLIEGRIAFIAARRPFASIRGPSRAILFSPRV